MPRTFQQPLDKGAAMRVEKQINDRIERERQKAERIADTAEKAFADAVLRMLQSAWQSQVPFEKADTEEERLAATLTFLTTLVKESIINEGAFQADNDPRKILAHEALRMLNDVVQGERHQIHKFFDGIRRTGRPRSSLDLHKGAIITACVKRVREIEVDRYPSRADIIRKIRKHPDLSPYLGDDNQVGGMVGRTEADPNAAWFVKNYYDALKEEGGATSSSVIDRAAFLVGLRHKPLDMRTAMTAKPVNIVIYNAGASQGQPLPDAIHRWAAGDAQVKLVEVARGQFVVHVNGQPMNGSGTVLENIQAAIEARPDGDVGPNAADRPSPDGTGDA